MRPILLLTAGVFILTGCASAPLAGRPGPAACGDFSFPIYFETNSDQLTAAARQVTADAVARVKGCRVSEVMVLGLADAGGTAQGNLALSRRRADTVAAALKKGGLPAPVFDIDAAGQNGALTAAGRPEPLRRRTEVVIRAAPPTP